MTLYTGVCSICETAWESELEGPRDLPLANHPGNFDIECPTPWCGVVSLSKVEP